MSVENYVRTAPDSLGKYIQAKEETKDEITVHTPVTILEDTSGNLVSPAKETGGNLATVATNVTIPTQTEIYTDGGSYGDTGLMSITLTKNAWSDYTQLKVSTDKAMKHFKLYVTDNVNFPSNGVIFLEFAAGSAGNEVAFLSFPWWTNAVARVTPPSPYDVFDFDIAVPAGSRISVRGYALTSGTAPIAIMYPMFMEG